MSFVGGSWFGASGEAFELTNCLLLDGVNDYVTLASNLTGLQTVQFWVKWSSFKTFNALFCIPSDYWGTVRYTIGSPYEIYIGKAANYSNKNIALPLINTAYHYVYKYNSSISKWESFINGTKIEQNSLLFSTLSIKDVGRNLSNSGITAYSNAKFAEVAAWDIPLSDADIADLYNSGAGDYATNFSPANLQMYWRLNETSGTTAADSSGNSKTGTLTNMIGTEWTTW